MNGGRRLIRFYFILGIFLMSCSSLETEKEQGLRKKNNTSITDCFTHQGAYAPGEKVNLFLTFLNKNKEDVLLKKVKVVIKDFSASAIEVLGEIDLIDELDLPGGDSIHVAKENIWTIPVEASARTCGVYIQYTLDSDSVVQSYQTFFAISRKNTLTSFQINREDFEGLAVFTLDGGLSAEYAIQKSAATLDGGISHSWFVKSYGSGPEPVSSTPAFLERSIKATTQFYNNNFGSTTPFETVIIGTGVPSISYLAHVMRAPVLPLQYLVSVNTVKEIQTILSRAEKNGTPSYASLGHDFSVTASKAVAWIKMLDLPEEYLEFIKAHHVKNVVFLGYTGTGAGETAARKIDDDSDHYAPGSIYIMHPAGIQSDQYLRQVITDMNQFPLTNMLAVADWESGIVNDQISNLKTAVKVTGVNTIVMTSANDIELWNLGTYAFAKFFAKNKMQLIGDGVSGISLNPYLISNPLYESWKGYIPFLYWQGFNASHHIDSRLATSIRQAIAEYLPDVEFEKLTFHVNSSHNFGGFIQGREMSNALKSLGLTVTENDFTTDEIWKPSDGMHASVETKAVELVAAGPEVVKKWYYSLHPLTPEDLVDMSQRFPLLKVVFN